MVYVESGQPLAEPRHRNRKSNPEIPGTVMGTNMQQASITDVTDMGVSRPNIDGSKTAAPTKHVHTNCGELMSHTTLINIGVSHPNSAGSETAAPTKYVHTTEGELIPHMAPSEGNQVSVPVIYVEEKEPDSRYVSETQKMHPTSLSRKHKKSKTSNMEKD